uniref:Uncharacterized protein n=1 Tax=Ditylenchus dipsaci TaxID=166011 RepID=A0A915CLR3_9BILA
MSLLWKILLEVESLFSKLSSTEAVCNQYQTKIKLSNSGPANLKSHLHAGFKTWIASDKTKFNSNVAAWIQEEVEVADNIFGHGEARTKFSSWIQEEVEVADKMFVNGEDISSTTFSPLFKRTTSFFSQLSDLFAYEHSDNDEQAKGAMIEIENYNKHKCIDPEADTLQF